MEVSEWLNAFGLGIIIGGIFGYIVRFLQNIKDDLDEIKRLEQKEIQRLERELERENVRIKDERGVSENHHINRIALGIVIILTAYAAFASQLATNRAENSIENSEGSIDKAAALAIKLDAVVACQTKYQKRTLKALSVRTKYTGRVADANSDLQSAQLDFLNVFLIIPPPTQEVRRESFQSYVKSLDHFVEISKKNKNARENYPYPDPDEFADCIDTATTKVVPHGEDNQ